MAFVLYAMLRGNMRSRKEIELDGARKDILSLEVLLDIRDFLVKTQKKSRLGGKPKKVGSLGGGLKTPTKNSV